MKLNLKRLAVIPFIILSFSSTIFAAPHITRSIPEPLELPGKTLQERYALSAPVVSFYYRFSPPIAGFIGRHETVRTMARWGFTPIVYGMRYPLVFTLLCCWVMLIALAGYRHIKKISY